MRSVSQLQLEQLSLILDARLSQDRSLLVYLDDVAQYFGEVLSLQLSWAGLLVNLLSGSRETVRVVLSHFPLHRLARLLHNPSLDVRHYACQAMNNVLLDADPPLFALLRESHLLSCLRESTQDWGLNDQLIQDCLEFTDEYIEHCVSLCA